MTHPLAFPPVIDSSMLTSYRACPRKWLYGYAYSLASPKPSIDLHAGATLARGFEITRHEYYIGEARGDQPRSISAGIDAVFEYWGDYEAPEGHAKNFGQCVNAFIGYFEHWPLKTDPAQPVIKADGSPAVEFTFTIPLPITHPETGDPILFGGRFDMLGLYEGKFICPVDEKSTGMGFGRDWAKKWNMRGQFMGYIWAAQQNGYKCDHFLVRGIGIFKRNIDFIDALVPVAQWQIDRWHTMMLETVTRMAAEWESLHVSEVQGLALDEFFPLNYGDTCTSFNKPCMYMDLCMSEHPQRYFGDFTHRVWHPTQKDPLALPPPTDEEREETRRTMLEGIG